MKSYVTGSHSVTIQDTGLVEVDGTIPVLSGLPLKDLQTEIRLNGDVVADRAAEYGVPYAALMGIQHGEGVIPVARQRKIPEDQAWTIESFDHGLGWFQITSKGLMKDREGNYLDRDEVLDPLMNTDIAARYVGLIRDQFGLAVGDVLDLPRVAAAYNAGSPRPGDNAWGLKTFRSNYIDEVVAANNTILLEFPIAPGRQKGVIRRLLRFLGYSVITAAAGFVAYKVTER